jgi:hypothetical protein
MSPRGVALQPSRLAHRPWLFLIAWEDKPRPYALIDPFEGERER